MERLIRFVTERRKLFIVIVLAAVGFIYFLIAKSKDEEKLLLPPYDQESGGTVTETGTENLDLPKEKGGEGLPAVQWIEVDVKGAVRNPGVYKIEENARVHDLLEKAGGTVEEADLSQVNLAAFLKDGQVVYIPRIGEQGVGWNPPTASISSKGGDAGETLIDLNSATLEELDQLPGIGPAKAESILRYREEHGPFKDVNELTNVSGIGEKTLEKLLPYITVR
ncbi:helix-hairpin-helix domain-containing protein [Thermicanus aegyptius]|uniref:helix-hairpin-helix domain-containing protein n=1 Tax=Thermicanus aegyptius TaxID=94009 RepID=UPI00040590DE|nr:helix-hairpin-helix domain-containing protein [Thermicanus aegyptius]